MRTDLEIKLRMLVRNYSKENESPILGLLLLLAMITAPLIRIYTIERRYIFMLDLLTIIAWFALTLVVGWDLWVRIAKDIIGGFKRVEVEEDETN